MALTFDQLQQLMKGEKLNYFIAPDRPVLKFGIKGSFGKYDIIVHIPEEGRFLQLRTVGYSSCPKDSTHLGAVLQVLATVNYMKRLVKLGWDPADGEIVAYADLWVMDNQVTQEQFSRMMGIYLSSVDQAYYRIKAAAETGSDPGDPPDNPSPKSGPSGEMAAELRDVLDRVRKGGGSSPAPAELPKEEPIKEV